MWPQAAECYGLLSKRNKHTPYFKDIGKDDYNQ